MKTIIFFLLSASFYSYGYTGLYEETYKVDGINEINCNGSFCNSIDYGTGYKIGSGYSATIEVEDFDSKTTCSFGMCETTKKENLYGF